MGSLQMASLTTAHADADFDLPQKTTRDNTRFAILPTSLNQQYSRGKTKELLNSTPHLRISIIFIMHNWHKFSSLRIPENYFLQLTNSSPTSFIV